MGGMSELVKIERMAYGPCGVGHLASGKTVFVEEAAPGDLVAIELVEEKERFATARIEEVVEAGGDRCAVPAGTPRALAPWAQLSYRAQLSAKEAIVRDALIRVGHLAPDEVDAALRPIVASADVWGYRNKIEMGVTRDLEGRLVLGFHAAGQTTVTPASECLLANHLIASAPQALQGALRYLEGRDGDLGLFRVGVRASATTGSCEVALWTAPGPFPRGFAAKIVGDAVSATSLVRVIAEEGAGRKVKRVEVLDGQGFWRERLDICGSSHPVSLQASAPSFFQVNTAQAAKLVEVAVGGLGLEEGERVADLYSGVGTFTTCLARTGAQVSAIELEGSAARDLRRNCEKARATVDVVCDDVSRALPSVAKGGLDALLVDPPRAGLDKRVISHIRLARPSRLAYVSCDPQTLARDVARLGGAGYRLVSATPVDMFPQTYHVETVVLMSRAQD